MDKPAWYDEHVSRGNIINVIVLVFLFGGFYMLTNHRLDTHDLQLEQHRERLAHIESLQISMAEVVLRQEHFLEQISNVERRAELRYEDLKGRIERLERQLRGRSPPQ